MQHLVLIKSNKITGRLIHKISLSPDQQRIFLDVEFKTDKNTFVIQKNFTNSPNGLEQMTKIADALNTEKQVEEYLFTKMGETNERKS